MASTYVNNLRLNEMATGDQSGTWGTTTNTNLELIGQALGWGTRAIANASTDNITIADGASDADRSMALKLTGGGQACTVTILPNTSSKVWVMENATAATLTFTQGSGANVAILAGETKMIATDGLGSGAVVYDVLTDLNLAGTTKAAGLTVAGLTSIGTNQKIQFRDAAIHISSSTDGQLDLVADTEIQIAATTVDINGAVDLSADLSVGDDLTVLGGVIDFKSNSGSPASLRMYCETSNAHFQTLQPQPHSASAANTLRLPNSGDSGTQDLVAVNITQTLTNKTLTAPTITGTAVMATLDISGDVDVDGTLEADAITLAGTALASIFSPIAGGGSIVTTGALNSGSITSGFGTINNGSSTITTTGTVATGAITAGGDITRGGSVYKDGSITDTGDFTLDVAGNILLDADGGDIRLKDAGTEFGRLTNNSTNFQIYSAISDADIQIKGNDGGSTVTALTFDMSDGGSASFNHDIKVADDGQVLVGTGGDLSIFHSSNTNFIRATTTDQDIVIQGSDGGSNITALTLDMSEAGAATFNAKITADAGIDIDNFNIDGTTIALSSGDMTLDAAGDIVLDAAGNDLLFKTGGTHVGSITNSSSNLHITCQTSDSDFLLRGNDGGSIITALTLDMSAAGAAIFNNDVTAFSDERLKSNITTIPDALSKVTEMRGVHYVRNETGKDSSGVIAQELQKIAPELVLTANDEMGTLSVNYGNITGYLIEAVKELSARVKELEGK